MHARPRHMGDMAVHSKTVLALRLHIRLYDFVNSMHGLTLVDDTYQDMNMMASTLHEVPYMLLLVGVLHAELHSLAARLSVLVPADPTSFH